MQSTRLSRPTGVTIIAILAIIGNIGILFLAIRGGPPLHLSNNTQQANPGLIDFLSIAALAQAIGGLVFGIGALRLQLWAWTLGIGIAGVGIILTLIRVVVGPINIGSALFGIALDGILLFYLFRPRVQQAFGRVN